MTKLTKPLYRETIAVLDGSFGKYRGRALIAGMSVGDVMLIRPKGTQQTETVSILDVYRFAIRCRCNRAYLEKARQRKERVAARRLAAKIKREDNKFKQPL